MWVKNTLCGIVLAAGINIGTAGCYVPGEKVPREQAEQSVDDVVRDSIEYFMVNDTARAQGLLEQYRNYLTSQKKAISPVPQTVMALAYAANWNNNARIEFTNLVHKFEQNPEILEKAQNTFEKYKANDFDLFETEKYKKTEKLVDGWARSVPKLNSALFFLKLLQHDYESAKEYCKKTLPEYKEKARDYFRIFIKLTKEASQRGDLRRVEGYATVLEAFIED